MPDHGLESAEVSNDFEKPRNTQSLHRNEGSVLACRILLPTLDCEVEVDLMAGGEPSLLQPRLRRCGGD